MSKSSEHVTRSDDGHSPIAAPFYLCLEGRLGLRPGPAPGRAWKLRGKHGGKVVEALVESRLPSEDTIRIRVEATGEQPMEHQISRVYEDLPPRFTLLTSLVLGETVSWEGGLTLPTVWSLGDAQSSVSENAVEHFERLQMSMRFKKFAGDKFRLPDWSPLGKKVVDGKVYLDNYRNEDVICIHQVLTGHRSGSQVADVYLYFAYSWGIVRATGGIMGRRFKYELAEIVD